MSVRSPTRRYFTDGLVALAPLSIAVLPFGIVYGVAAAGSDIDTATGISASWIVLAGASQLTLLDLLSSDASWFVAVGTGLLINSRFVLYSTALAPAFLEFPPRWRFPLCQLMTDQATAVSLAWFEDHEDPVARRSFFFGAGMMLAIVWMVGTLIGVFAGASIPESWELEFAVPLVFLALVIPTLRTRPTLLAAVVAVAVTMLAADLPQGTNLLVGSFCGILAGTVAER